MSQENVEIVLASLDAWNQGDWDTALLATAPDIAVTVSGVGEWRGLHTGQGEVRRLWDAFVEPWESVRLEPEYIDAGEHVVARVTGRFVGRDGIEVQTQTGWCWTLHDELITHVLISNDFGETLEAAGVWE